MHPLTEREVEELTPAQFDAYQAERKREEYFAAGRGLLGKLRRPGPGYGDEEIARAVERRREREEAAAAEKERKREEAARARAERQAAYATLVEFRSALKERQGRARFELEQAAVGYDIDAAEAAAVRLDALGRVADFLKANENRIRSSSLGRSGPVPGAEVV